MQSMEGRERGKGWIPGTGTALWYPSHWPVPSTHPVFRPTLVFLVLWHFRKMVAMDQSFGDSCLFLVFISIQQIITSGFQVSRFMSILNAVGICEKCHKPQTSKLGFSMSWPVVVNENFTCWRARHVCKIPVFKDACQALLCLEHFCIHFGHAKHSWANVTLCFFLSGENFRCCFC